MRVSSSGQDTRLPPSHSSVRVRHPAPKRFRARRDFEQERHLEIRIARRNWPRGRLHTAPKLGPVANVGFRSRLLSGENVGSIPTGSTNHAAVAQSVGHPSFKRGKRRFDPFQRHHACDDVGAHLYSSDVKTAFNKDELGAVVASSRSVAEVLRKLNRCETGGNHVTAKKYIEVYHLDTSHFESQSDRARRLFGGPRRALEAVLIEGSRCSRTWLKQRLLREGLKKEECEMCGQGPLWRGLRMSLILDHINGVRNDNRLINLRMLCPNCAATLETHCGRRSRARCPACEKQVPLGQRYCRRSCFYAHGNRMPKPNTRKVVRPRFDRLLHDVERLGYVKTGKKYGVSDNAIRKWIASYRNSIGS